MADEVIHEPEKGRFLIKTEYGKAKLKYWIENEGSMNIKKTKVPHRLRGLGLGKRLVDAALHYARGNNLNVVPTCFFVQKILKSLVKVG
jgi:predicted GNAT family acetyltransferase